MYYFADGSKYDGQWENGKKQGRELTSGKAEAGMSNGKMIVARSGNTLS
ncbi:MAG: hypothetical protein ACLU30_14275 [Odoribacter splanchnicus]